MTVMGEVRVLLKVRGYWEREVRVPRGTRIRDILLGVGLNPVEVVVTLRGEPVPEDERVTSDVELEVYPVVPLVEWHGV